MILSGSLFLTITIAIFSYSCNFNRIENYISLHEKAAIHNAFEKWKIAEIEKGNFISIDSCNLEYYEKNNPLEIGNTNYYAIPTDSSEVNYYYSDINGDNKKDALITFSPHQCDGGNATQWVQYQILVLSQNQNYSVIDNYFEKFNNYNGFFHLDSISTNSFFGTYFEFKEDDGNCCPSIKKPIKIDFRLNKLVFIEN